MSQTVMEQYPSLNLKACHDFLARLNDNGHIISWEWGKN